MTRFAIYDRSTGAVGRIFEGDEDDARLQTTAGEAIVDAGAAIDVRPDAAHELRVVGGALAWVDPRCLDDIRDEKWEAVKAERSRRESEPFEWDGSWFDADLPRFMGAALRGKDTVWTLADNSLRFMTSQEIYAVAQALGDRTDQIFERARLLRTMIYDTKYPQQIAAINWNSPLAELI